MNLLNILYGVVLVHLVESAMVDIEFVNEVAELNNFKLELVYPFWPSPSAYRYYPPANGLQYFIINTKSPCFKYLEKIRQDAESKFILIRESDNIRFEDDFMQKCEQQYGLSIKSSLNTLCESINHRVQARWLGAVFMIIAAPIVWLGSLLFPSPTAPLITKDDFLEAQRRHEEEMRKLYDIINSLIKSIETTRQEHMLTEYKIKTQMQLAFRVLPVKTHLDDAINRLENGDDLDFSMLRDFEIVQDYERKPNERVRVQNCKLQGDQMSIGYFTEIKGRKLSLIENIPIAENSCIKLYNRPQFVFEAKNHSSVTNWCYVNETEALAADLKPSCTTILNTNQLLETDCQQSPSNMLNVKYIYEDFMLVYCFGYFKIENDHQNSHHFDDEIKCPKYPFRVYPKRSMEELHQIKIPNAKVINMRIHSSEVIQPRLLKPISSNFHRYSPLGRNFAIPRFSNKIDGPPFSNYTVIPPNYLTTISPIMHPVWNETEFKNTTNVIGKVESYIKDIFQSVDDSLGIMAYPLKIVLVCAIAYLVTILFIKYRYSKKKPATIEIVTTNEKNKKDHQVFQIIDQKKSSNYEYSNRYF